MVDRKRKPSLGMLVGICIVIVVLIIGIALLVHRSSWETGGKGTKSPYRWKEEGKEVTFSFDTSKLGKGKWKIEGNDNGFFKIKQKESSDSQIFYISGKYKGTMILEFSFVSQSKETLYQMMAEIEVSDNDMTIKRTSAKDMAETKTEGKDTQNPFTYKVDEEGKLILRISNVEESDWVYNKDEVPFYIAGPDFENSTMEITVRNGWTPDLERDGNLASPSPTQKEGTKAALKVSNKRLGASIALNLEVDKNGWLAVKSVSAKGPSKEELAKIREAYKPSKIMTDKELEALEKKEGKQKEQKQEKKKQT